jgi:hypothetical protein
LLFDVEAVLLIYNLIILKFDKIFQMKNIIILRLLVLCVLMVAIVNLTGAQCPMCKIATESNLSNGGNAGKGLNAGIFYLLLVPYALVGGVAFYWYKNRKKDDSIKSVS